MAGIVSDTSTRLADEIDRLRLIETIGADAGLGGDLDQVLARALETLCDFTGWPVGHIFWRDPVSVEPVLISSGLWRCNEGRDLTVFRAVSNGFRFHMGEGLPGRVMEAGQAIWWSDVSEDPRFLRASFARASGLRAAFAFPAMVGGEAAAVLEFFLDEAQEPDEALLRTLDKIGAILGRAIGRDRAQAGMRAKAAQLQALVVEAETQRRAAEAASAAKTAFLAVTSHEVRTPLNAVLGLAEALAREPLTERQADLVAGIRDSGGMLLRLLNAVLDVAKIESGQARPQIAPVDLTDLAQTVVRLWSGRASEQGLTLELDISPLPRPCIIASDAGKIEQTLVNLISNAIKFSPHGATVSVRVSAVERGDRLGVGIEVLDQGPGVPEADRTRIFSAFEQTLEGREAGGAGLGLAICAGNIRALGGEIGVAPRAGRGSRFWVSFFAEPAELAAQTSTELPRVPADFRILAAEDNLLNQKVLGLLLEPLGIVPTFVEDGEAAIAALRAETFDIVLMDANMPRMNGETAVRAIRSMQGPRAKTPIYMLTANVFDEDRRRYLSAGVNGVIAKPIVVTDLYTALASAMPDDGEEDAAA